MAHVADRVLRLIADPAAEPFDALALDVHAFQLEANPAYRAWCEAAGGARGVPSRPSEIPAVPVAAFKELDLVCGAPVVEFRTSGTGGTGRGRHLLPDLAPYRASAVAGFGAAVMPEGWRLRTLVLAPPPRLRPHSSLSRMLEWIVEAFGEPGSSGWFVGPGGLDADALAEALLDAARAGTPVLLAGTSAALLAFLDYADRTGLRLALPGGSRLVDTGGQKGTGAAAPRPPAAFQAGLYARVADRLGIPPARCVNEYGMTELCSQAYDAVPAGGTGPRIKRFPPWVRADVLDPVTLEPARPGETGLLRVLDLANVGSVCAVLTEDLARAVDGGGFELLGRPRAAEARGCGLTFAELHARGGAP